MMITRLQDQLLSAIDEHGPLTFTEASVATGGTSWSDVHDALESLKRQGYVVIFNDDHVRLTALGRRRVQEAR